MNYKKLAGAGAAALGFILFAVLVWPLFKGIGALKEAVENKQTVLEQRKGLVEKVRSLKKAAVARKENIDQLAIILPADKKTQEIVVNIEEAARQSGVGLKELKTASVVSQEKNTSYQTMQVELSGSGRYQSILDLFQSLEKNLRIFDIQEFTISLDSAGEASGLLNIDLKLFTYYLNDSAVKK